MTPDVSAIGRPLKYYRTNPTKGAPVRVERDGGKFGAGLIRGVSLLSVGEALGHGEWVDLEFSKSVAAAVNRPNKGVKVRFTHPSVSGDGLGRFMGRALEGRLNGRTGQAVADIHLAAASHDTPDGDLGKYVMDLAEEDPEAFAISIAFERDTDAEAAFTEENTADADFESPDDANTNNYPHVRLRSLIAADFVDSPAANPGGLFHQGEEIADEADRLFAYALGLSSEKPELACFDADPDRFAAYANRFLDRHGLSLQEKTMAQDDTGTPEAVTQESLDKQFAAFGESLFAKLDEKLSAIKPADEPEPKKFSEEDMEADRKRVADLYALANSSCVENPTETAEKWAKQNLSVVEAKAALADRLLASNSLTNDSGKPDEDPAAKLRAEFSANAAVYADMGITEEEYIAAANDPAVASVF